MYAKYITDDPSESGWVQTGQTLLRHGWSVGKKVAMAGAAISVAPVVIPPLLVFSAFGLALSVPFGIYYAGVAGTERLMQSLLPLNQNQLEVDEILEEEKGYFDERDSWSEEIWEREGDDEIVEEGVGYVGQRGFKPDENGEGKDDVVIVEYPEGDKDAIIEESGEMNKDDVVVESLDERYETAEKGSGEVSERDIKPEKDEETDSKEVAVERIIDITSATVDKDFVTMDKVEITLSTEGPVQGEAASPDVADEKGMATTETHSKVAKKEKKGKKGSGAVNPEGADVSEVKGKSDMADAESQSSVEHVGEVKDFNSLASASAESAVTSEAEEFHTEKELWEQLRALRTIVGYRAAIKKTVPSELRALYVFTGVDLPATARDVSNLLDLNYKLQFLKSVIGVK